MGKGLFQGGGRNDFVVHERSSGVVAAGGSVGREKRPELVGERVVRRIALIQHVHERRGRVEVAVAEKVEQMLFHEWGREPGGSMAHHMLEHGFVRSTGEQRRKLGPGRRC